MLNSGSPPCDVDQLRRYIEEDVSSQEQTDVERHLDTCRICRERIESLAADPDEWSDAIDVLRATRTHGLSHSPGAGPSTRTLERNADALAADRASLDVSLEFLAPTDDPRMLGRLGPYEIVGVVGCGGMGIVLKAFDATLNRYVAIKVLSPQLATNANARRRFAREGQAAAAVVHEHVVAIHAVDEAGGMPYLVMQYVPGESLQKRIEKHGPLRLEEILRISRQTALGLAAAHAQGIVHRDVKPANILLTTGVERVLVTDFGLARAVDDASMTCSGVITGTPQYMAPEQALGDSLDLRADLFSLGSVMYAMCTGRSPFRAQTTIAVLRRICDEQPRAIRDVNPKIPDWLAEIVARLHEKEPENRFQTSADVAELLGKWLAHVQQPSRIPPPQRLPRRNGARVKWLVSGIGIVTAALIVFAGLYFAGLLPTDRGRDMTPSRGLVVPLGDTEPDSPQAMATPGEFLSAHDLAAELRGIDEVLNALEAASDTPAGTLVDTWRRDVSDIERRMSVLEQEVASGGN